MDSEEIIDILDLEMPRVGPGRQAKPVETSFVRELTVEDLRSTPVKTQAAPAINKLRDTHHALARALATGSSEHEASLITGYSPSRISILKADPTFQELLEFYRLQGAEKVADFRERMAVVGMTALSELAERLEDNPEEFNPALLTTIVKDMADRTGHAPQRGPTTVNNTQINVGLSERMERARARTAEALAASKVIEHE